MRSLNPAFKENGTGKASQRTRESNSKYKIKIVWRNVIVFSISHYYLLTYFWFWLAQTSWTNHLYVWLLIVLSSIGVTGGAHRLWSHKAYKGNTAYRLLMMFLDTLAFQGSIYEWVRNHRTHHKFTDTDADPHNSKRGFFFCHMGWLMVRKHPEVIRKSKSIDMSDIEKDWIVMWQKKYYPILMPLVTFVIPALIPIYFWNVDPSVAFGLFSFARWQACLHGTWFVNSAAHLWGTKPYESSISAVQNIYVSFWAFGEGWHNYHHAFPWDYKASENPYFFNFTTAFIDFFSQFGWTYDLKTVKPDMIAKRALRTGDGTHPSVETRQLEKEKLHPENDRDHNDIWGWDDRDLTDDQREIASIIYPEQL